MRFPIPRGIVRRFQMDCHRPAKRVKIECSKTVDGVGPSGSGERQACSKPLDMDAYKSPNLESTVGENACAPSLGSGLPGSPSLDRCPSFGSTLSLADRLLDLERRQTLALCSLTFGPPVATVYHPIDYASEPHSDYVRRYCRAPKTVVFIGMNPGPFGMVQSGVPFGDCRVAKEWLGVRGAVRKPSNESPKRPILGLDCPRSEVSGTRFWNFIRSLARDDDPNSFFQRCYVHNYCPAAFVDAKGKNITPPTMKKSDLVALESICDEYLAEAIDLLGASIVVGIGSYAYERCRRVLRSNVGSSRPRVEMIMHPSPANPATNTGGGWPVKVRSQLEQLDLLPYMAV